jgi:hypothetical protein
MRGKISAVSDEEDDIIYEINEEDRPVNVYDPVFDSFIDVDIE